MCNLCLCNDCRCTHELEAYQAINCPGYVLGLCPVHVEPCAIVLISNKSKRSFGSILDVVSVLPPLSANVLQPQLDHFADVLMQSGHISGTVEVAHKVLTILCNSSDNGINIGCMRLSSIHIWPLVLLLLAATRNTVFQCSCKRVYIFSCILQKHNRCLMLTEHSYSQR